MYNQHKHTKNQKKHTRSYHPNHGWAHYNKQQKQTASCFLLLPPELIEAWYDKKEHPGKGKRCLYSDQAIEFILSLKMVFQISLRRAEGVAREVLKMQGIELPVADYSTLSRRQGKLKQSFTGKAKIVILDSSGFQLFKASEYRQKRFKLYKHKNWRKLHIGIDAETGRVITASSTHVGRHDGQELPKLVRHVEAEQVMCDGAYDHSAN